MAGKAAAAADTSSAVAETQLAPEDAVGAIEALHIPISPALPETDEKVDEKLTKKRHQPCLKLISDQVVGRLG